MRAHRVASIALALAAAAVAPAMAVAPKSTILVWTAPGDNARIGRVKAYDIRMSKSPISSSNFYSATRLPWAGMPVPGGLTERWVVSGLSAGETYYFAIRAVDKNGNRSAISNVVVHRQTIPTEQLRSAPVAGGGAIDLSNPWPNPATSQARMNLRLPSAAPVTIEAFDIAGRRVKTVVDDRMGAGENDVIWNLDDADGRRLSPGIYMLRAKVGSEVFKRRVIVAG